MARTVTTEEKMTDRIGKLIRQAEGAPEGSPEREAFMDRAMRLSQAHSIDMVVARAKAYDKEKIEEPEARRYEIAEFSYRRNKTSQNEHLIDLLLALAEAFDMRALIAHSRTWVELMGYPSDHGLVERMYSMLSVQMVAEADAALKRGDHKVERTVPVTRREEIPEEERAWGEEVNPEDWNDDKRYASTPGEVGLEDEYFSGVGGRWVTYTLQAPPTHRNVPVLDAGGNQVYETRPVSSVDGRIWRTNFYKGFVSRVAIRMREARKQAMREAGIDDTDKASSEKGLMLLNKAEEIDDRYEREMVVRASKKGGYNGAEVSKTSHHAHVAGQEAAEKATYGDERVVD